MNCVFTSKYKMILFQIFRSGFNILLYGVGSKLKVLKQFCKDFLEDALYIVLYGFFPSLTLKQVNVALILCIFFMILSNKIYS